MLDFTLDASAHIANETNAGAAPAKIARSGVERRAAATDTAPPSSTPPRRRRHDSLNNGKHVALEW